MNKDIADRIAERLREEILSRSFSIPTPIEANIMQKWVLDIKDWETIAETYLLECPKCHKRQSVIHSFCIGCDEDLDKAKVGGSVKYYYVTHDKNEIRYIKPCGFLSSNCKDTVTLDLLEGIYNAMHEIKVTKRIQHYRWSKYTEKREKEKRRRAILADPYIKQLLKRDTWLTRKDFPEELIELKRLQIVAKRELKKLNTGRMVR